MAAGTARSFRALPLVFSSIALAVSLSGVGPADAARAVKRALFADNAAKVNGIRASRTPTAGQLLPLGSDGRFSPAVLPAGMRGPRGLGGPSGPPGSQGPTGPLGVAGGDLQGTYPNPTIKAGAVGASELTNTTAFRAYKTAAQDAPGGSSVAVLLGGEDFDPGSNFDTATSRYTAPITGYYEFSATVAVTGSGGRMFPEITTSRAGMGIRGTDITYPASCCYQGVAMGMMHLIAGDTVGVAMYTASAQSLIAANITQFSGFLVSAG